MIIIIDTIEDFLHDFRNAKIASQIRNINNKKLQKSFEESLKITNKKWLDYTNNFFLSKSGRNY